MSDDMPAALLAAPLPERHVLNGEPIIALLDPLTERELEVLYLIAEGLSNQQIADQLVIGVGTVKGHINHLLSKLSAQNRTEAVARARRLGLLMR
jgi:LuxR family maltose regulon positive regulatory protein